MNTPTTEAYEGELEMARGLIRILRLAARSGDWAEVTRLLWEHASDDAAARAEAAPKPNFFQPGHTYTRHSHGSIAEFNVHSIHPHPNGQPVAFGWYRRQPRTAWHAYTSDDFFDGWTDSGEEAAP